ncbi:hypothetical protein SAMN04515621_2002 [Erythrobacter sp. HL-111]|nr:MAG: hypothetical protein HLUCCO15_01840 [Erythrobacteraceae bacterium HL-111]SDS67313.1 hypothetical protein SAMN04515621_2002 [Erythrobacter sp. HL-111]
MTRLREVGTGRASELLEPANGLLAKAPLEEEPFIVAALTRYDEGRYEEATRLLDIARRRSARSFEARFLAVDANMAAGNIDRAVKDLEALLRLAPEQAALTRETLVLLSGHPETGPVALEAIEEDRTKLMVLTALARAEPDPGALIEAIRTTRAAEAVRGDPRAVDPITRPLIDAGDYPGAYRVWSELVGRRPGEEGLITDPEFGGDLPPPFGWSLRSGPEGYAALGPSGLSGEAYGRRTTELARQVLLLPAGSYRLRAEVLDPSEAIELRVQCLGGEEIVRTRLREAGAMAARFSVSPDCRAQSLELRARASDPPRAAAFSIESITIEGDGA